MPVHQGCVKGVIYPVVQSVAKQSAATKEPAKKRVYRYKPRTEKTCKVCGNKVPSDRHPTAETCCDDCSAELQRKRSREYMRRHRLEMKNGA